MLNVYEVGRELIENGLDPLCDIRIGPRLFEVGPAPILRQREELEIPFP